MKQHTEFECATCWRLYDTEDEAGACCAPRPEQVTVYECEMCGRLFTVPAVALEHEAAHESEATGAGEGR